MSAIEFDDTQWPLVIVTFEGVSTEPEFDDYLRRMSGYLARKETIATVLDATRAGPTPPTQRRKQAEWMRENEAVLRRQSAGTAFVISSAVVRGVLTAILWLQPIPQEHVVVATRAEGIRWAREQLRKRGVNVAA